MKERKKFESAWCVIKIVLSSLETILCTFYCIRVIVHFYLGRGRDTINTIRQLFSTNKIAVWDFFWGGGGTQLL